MAPPVSEFANLSLKPGTNVDKGGDAAAIWDESFKTLQQVPGFQRAYWGNKVEDPSNMQMIIDWDEHESHVAFTKAPEYGPFVENIGKVLAGPPSFHHIVWRSHPPTAGLSQNNAPATEILSLYFPTSMSEADRNGMLDRFEGFGKLLKQEYSGFRGFNAGWLWEDHVPYEKAEGGKATMFKAVIGWDSVEAHEACRQTQVFKDNIHIVRQAPQLVGLDVFHIHSTDVS